MKIWEWSTNLRKHLVHDFPRNNFCAIGTRRTAAFDDVVPFSRNKPRTKDRFRLKGAMVDNSDVLLQEANDNLNQFKEFRGISEMSTLMCVYVE